MTYENLRNAVFKINTAQGSGSGFYLEEYDVVVTNFHVIEGFKKVAIENQSKDRFVADVVFGNPETDIAFLKADRSIFKSGVSFNDVIPVQNRDKVWVIGFPFGMPYTETEGIISNSNQLMEGRYFVQIDAAVNPGNSGGPVVNKDGKLLGVTTAKFSNAENMGFAIPASMVMEELASLAGNEQMRYSIKCNSCKNLVFEKTDYCPICGATVNENLFDEKEQDAFALFVESALSSLNMDPVLARTGFDYWQFYQGSSQIRIFVYNQNYLYATSPLNQLPSKDLEKLYSYLLSDPAPPYNLGVYANQIFLSYRIHISDIYSKRAGQIRTMLTNLPLKADEMDDFFIVQYGCEKTNYTREVDL